jgi:MFS family permease
MREAMELDAYAALRSRNYRLLQSEHLLSHLGLQMLSVAVSWDLYLATKSAIVLGNVGFVQIAPALLLGLHAGHIADRYDRRRIVVLAQALVLIGSGLLVAAPVVRENLSRRRNRLIFKACHAWITAFWKQASLFD